MVIGISEWIGKRSYNLILGFILTLFAHLMYYDIPECPPTETCLTSIVPAILIGIGSLLIQTTVLLGTLCLIEEYRFGLAIGLIICSTSIGYCVGSFLTGVLIDNHS